MNLTKPILNEQLNYFKGYIEKALGESLFESFEKSTKEFESILELINQDNASYAYEEGKWTLKQVVKHLTDAERIFAYRALTVSRNDPNHIPGFEENDYADNDDSDQIDYKIIMEEWKAVRQATILLYKTFSTDALSRIGTINNTKQNALTIGWLISGHTQHHLQVIKERYLKTSE